MNLIEKLGGYEKAKEKAKEIDFDLNNLDFSGGGSPMESMYERLESIEIAILEHRRENNIFEVGDYIIDSLMGNSVIRYHDGYKHMEDHYVRAFLKHATPEEIKAGHRL